MTLVTGVLILFGVGLAILLAYSARKRRAELSKFREVLETLEPIHIPALLNLVDPSQQRELKSLIPPAEFAALERKRVRALIVYVKRIYRNSGILIVCADAAAQSVNPEIALAAEQLQNVAFKTRRNALYSLVFLYGALVMPKLSGDVTRTVSGYLSAHNQFASLSTLIPAA